MKRTEFPILLIGMHDYVEGATRLQKYAFLSAMQIKELRSFGFYNDWRASNFGPFSEKLASDVTTALHDGLISKFPVKNRYDYLVDRFAVSESGKTLFDTLKWDYSRVYNKIFSLTSRFQSKSLSELLQNVYYQYPQYATASKIKAEMGKKIYESDSYLSTMYDEPDN